MDSYTTNTRSPLFLVLALVFLALASSSDNSKDKEECAESLVGLATCLPYVGGTTNAPTPDCCTALKQVLNTNKKCLCVIIKDRNDPDLGLNINATLALGLPHVCNAPADISECPALLNLAPNSADAQIFHQKSNNGSSSPDDNVKPNPSSANTIASSDQQKSGGSGNEKRNTRLDIVVGVVFLWCFTANLII